MEFRIFHLLQTRGKPLIKVFFLVFASALTAPSGTRYIDLMPIQLVIPMTGQGVRFREAGYSMPKPLVPVSGIPMIERLLSKFPIDWETTFVIADNHVETGLKEVLLRLRPEAKILTLPAHKKGPSYAVLAALKTLPTDSPVLVSYCDYSMVWDARQFQQFVSDSDCDACVISYRGFHAHYLHPQMYAYCRMNQERVVEVKEKGCFTENRENEFASAGTYYFKSAALLEQSIEYQMKIGLELNGEFYTSLTVEALLRQKKDAHVRVFEVPYFFQWGTPQDVRDFEYWERAYRCWNTNQGAATNVAQVLMPMAGKGSRFKGSSEVPKPLVPVNGVPMFRAALQTLPSSSRSSLVVLDEFKDEVEKLIDPKVERLLSLPITPPGQAFSTEAGIELLSSQQEVLVSSCDHGIVFDPKLWRQFHETPNCDAAIFTMLGYPGAARRPLAYSYVVPAIGTENFPRVERVSVKQNTQTDPMKDHVLVGTFWFRSLEILKNGLEKLKVKDLRTNGELYLDSIFTVMMESNLQVRMFPLQGYLCWGDPDARRESLYWQSVFGGYSTR